MIIPIIAVTTCAVAAWTDLRRGEIPNWLTFGAFLAGVGVSVALAAPSLDPVAVGRALLGAVGGGLACAVLPLVMWRAGVMGGGDVKLFIALGALCHAATGLDILVTSFVAGSIVAPFQLAVRGQLFVTGKRIVLRIVNAFLPASMRAELPPAEAIWFRFGPAILLATIWVVATTHRPWWAS
ncbi:MAG: prepilin peptidase [Labilithrix sp.]|nr:prepilin peptidase [Labilithrix sp.]